MNTPIHIWRIRGRSLPLVALALATVLAVWLLALVGMQPRQAAATDAPKYTITDLGAIPDNTDSIATAINGSGQVVGNLFNRYPAPNMAFLYENGVMTKLGTLPNGQNSEASGINDNAQIVGNSTFDATNARRAFLYENGAMTNLGTLPNSGPNGQSFANDINDSGQVVGYSDTTEGFTDGIPREHAFLYENGTMNDIGTLIGSNQASVASGINKSGQIVGNAAPITGGVHAFLYENGTMTDLSARMGADYSIAEDINNSGQVVGSMTPSGLAYRHAFLYGPNGSVSDLGTLSGTESRALAINGSGQVVGYSTTGGNLDHAFLYENGTMTDLNDLIPAGSGWVLVRAYDINDSGMIVGWGVNPNGSQHAFLLTPPYNFGGFFQPVDNPPTFNTVKAGSAIPVKFSLGGDKGLNIFNTGYPKSSAVSCNTQAPTDAIEQTVSTADAGKLSYDASSGQYTYVWKTDKGWMGTCRTLDLGLNDGSPHQAYFKFTK